MKRGRRRMLRWIGAGALLALVGLVILARLAGFGLVFGHWFSGGAAQAKAELLEGNWAGTWASSSCGMSGALRCRIDKRQEGVYQAQFAAVFAKYFTHSANVMLKVGRTGDAWEFAGQQDLGLLGGGVYKYEGRCDGTEFTCGYDSSWDKGTFRLKRQ